MISVNTTLLFHVVKLVHVILSNVLTYLLNTLLTKMPTTYKMLVVFDQYTVEYRIPF